MTPDVKNDKFELLTDVQSNSHSLFDISTIPKCCGCEQPILDRFIHKVLDRPWHAKCLKCRDCGALLADKCFARNGYVYCKDDFFRRFGTKCAGCEQGIPPTQVVRRAQDNVYHLQCFACIICSRQMNTGDEFYLMDDNKLVCKTDYEAAKARGSIDIEGSNKRPRTTITAKQLETLKTAYNNSPKPARHVREQLSQDTGLDMRVVQVWFQNRRAKEKRLKKDAGRTRWGQYFSRNIKHQAGGKKRSDSRSDDQLSIDDDKDDVYDDDLLDMDREDSFDSSLLDQAVASLPNQQSTGGSSGSSNGGLFMSSSPIIGSGNGRYVQLPSTPPFIRGSAVSPAPGATSAGSSNTPIAPQSVYPSEMAMLYASSNTPMTTHGMSDTASSDISNSSTNQGYDTFPPSPTSWIEDMESANSTTGGPVHY